MNIKQWRERADCDWQAEIDELRAALKAQPVQPALTDLSRLEPFVHGLGKAILREFQERVRTGGAG